ncbi:cellulose binding domain-containing protein [Kitasatospora cinereorecta]|uniref:Endoglucanase n=1 Tax=Kitasatospora cinereorecta TaxID=285560 RepID=A0ABW0VMH9_9ACTN
MSVRTTALALGAALAATAAATLSLTAAPGASAASVACTVDYGVNDWGSGFTANVAISNKGTTPINGWTLGYAYTGNQTLSGTGWNGTWTQSGRNVTVTSAAYNAAIAPGGSVGAGANFAYTGTNTAPTAFTVNGTPCTGAPAPSPSPSPSPSPTATTTPPPAGSAPALHVSGNSLLDEAGSRVTLHGVNRSGTEFMCVQGHGFFDGPTDAAAIAAIKSWKGVNAVRVPLNEDCWLGQSDVNPAYAGANYRTAIKTWVDALRTGGLTPIVDLHWSRGQYTGNSAGCADLAATCQKPMPGAEAVPFWTSVADTFKADPAVVLDLFNEPYPDRSESSTAQAWLCWRDGNCPGIGYRVSGMQTLLDTVRATGARNVVLLGGIAYSNDLGQWLAHRPTDPTGNLGAAWHVYNFNSCANSSCWASTVAPVADQVPLAAGEIGESDCAHGFIDQVMSWLDSRRISYLGWTWNTWNCGSGPSLITSYDGTPTAFGAGLRDHLAGLG